MERVKQIRRVNFESLLREWKLTAKAAGRKGTLKEFVEQHKLDRSYTSQIKIGVREVGDDVARRIERNHEPRLKHGWMDTEHNELDPSGPLEEAYQRLAITLYRSDPKGMTKLMSTYKAARDNIIAKKVSKLTAAKRSR